MCRAHQWLLACLLYSLQLFASPVCAQGRVLDVGASGTAPVSLTPYFSLLEDPTRQLTLPEVISPPVAARFKGGLASAEAETKPCWPMPKPN